MLFILFALFSLALAGADSEFRADIRKMNQVRRHLAHKRHIHVPDLVWSEELAKEVARLKCADPMPAKHIRFSPLKVDANAQILEKIDMTFTLLFETVDAHHGHHSAVKDILHALYPTTGINGNQTDYVLEFFNPLQTTIGCAPYNCVFSAKRASKLVQLHDGHFKSLCFLGNSSTWGHYQHLKTEILEDIHAHIHEGEESLRSARPENGSMATNVFIALTVLVAKLLY